jgi:prepilin-type N-terminal cleavage/methylation domain-containing protein
MLHFNVNKDSNPHQSEQGFTLIELIVVILLVGILSAIAAPGFLGSITQARVRDGQNLVRGALAEAQQEAIRKSKSCLVTIPNDVTNPTITGNCFILGNRRLNNLRIRHNNTVTGNLFDFKGRTSDGLSNHLVIVISAVDNYSYQKCIVVSDGLGLIRTGNYPRNDSGNPTVDKCNTN